MIDRYAVAEVTALCRDEHVLGLWQETELAVLDARVKLGEFPEEAVAKIKELLVETPIDVPWWIERDTEIHHDLIAFLDERRRHLPSELRHYLHKDMTSYDTEEPAFARMLTKLTELVVGEMDQV